MNLAPLDAKLKDVPHSTRGSGYLAWTDKITLRPGETADFVFPVVCGVGEQGYKNLSARAEKIYRSYKNEPLRIVSESRKVWDRLVAAAPKPLTRKPALRRLYYKSLLTLEGLKWAPYRTSPCYPYQASFPSKGNYNGHWLWDSCFHALGYREYDIKTAEDQIHLLLKFQDQKTGLIPNYISPDGTYTRDRSQPPVVGWAAWKVYEKSRNRTFLKDVYDPICEV